MTSVVIRSANPSDRAAIMELLDKHWGGEMMVVHGVIYRPADLPAFIAQNGVGLVGLATYAPGPDEYELVSLDSLASGQGIGSRLLAAVEDAARTSGCRRVSLVTTNDNVDALRFYQRHGYRITAVDPGAVDRSRRIKPTISEIGFYGIPIRDELTLVKALDGAAGAESGESL